MLWSKCSNKGYILFLLLFYIKNTAFCQTDSVPLQQRGKVYQLNLKYELPVSVVSLGASYWGFQALDRSSAYDADDISRLNPDNINRFDRPAAFYDPSLINRSQANSDLVLNISILSPVLLMIDKQIRKDWLDLLTLYLVSHTVDNALYFAAAFPVRRARPFTYNPEIPLEQKLGVAKSNSFFSGHVSFAATSTFFMAKVFTDYRQIKGWKRVAVFSAAAVPPALVGYYRMRAGKHFRTDVITGFLVGAASGILVPEFHRRISKHNRLTLSPFYTREYSGFTMNVKLGNK